MPYKDYTILRSLASGGTAHVYEVKDNDTEEILVMKITSFKKLQKKIWLNEVNMLQKLQYVRGIVKMIEYGEVADQKNDSFGYIILEKCGLDLFESPIKTNEIKTIFLFLYHILTTLHSMGYCYCDLKIENILRQGKGFRLCDFSSCQPIGTLTNVMYGTPHVIAPELLIALEKKQEYYYDEKIDSWGLGCVMYEIITGEKFDRHKLQDFKNVTDVYYKTIIQECLEHNPTTRVRIRELSKKMKQTNLLPNQDHPNLLLNSCADVDHSHPAASVVTVADRSCPLASDLLKCPLNVFPAVPLTSSSQHLPSSPSQKLNLSHDVSVLRQGQNLKLNLNQQKQVQVTKISASNRTLHQNSVAEMKHSFPAHEKVVEKIVVNVDSDLPHFQTDLKVTKQEVAKRRLDRLRLKRRISQTVKVSK